MGGSCAVLAMLASTGICGFSRCLGISERLHAHGGFADFLAGRAGSGMTVPRMLLLDTQTYMY